MAAIFSWFLMQIIENMSGLWSQVFLLSRVESCSYMRGGIGRDLGWGWAEGFLCFKCQSAATTSYLEPVQTHLENS